MKWGMGRGSAGLTLIELMIAVALVGVGILAAFGTFSVAQRSISSSKARTLAVNLAQQEMQVLMQKTYFEILVSTNVGYNSNYTPPIPYDLGYFKPQTILQGGLSFTYLTYIQVVQEVGGVIQTLPPNTPDTGIRQITISVVWQGTNGPEITNLKSIINNPNTVMSTVIIQGTITDAVTLLPIPSAVVDFAEDVGWRDATNALGRYRINMSPGSFHFAASAPGYYPASYYMSVPPNSNPVQNAALTPISTGTVSGTAWFNRHLVVSQVVASTGPAGNFEYVELYNPTTSTFNIGTGVTSMTKFYIFDSSNNTVPNPGFVPVALTYVSTAVASYHYYLIANTTTVVVAGLSRQADAYYTTPPTHYLSQGDAGGVGIWDSASNKMDSVGWASVGLGHVCPSAAAEGTCISNAAGLGTNEAYVRRTDTGSVISPTSGRAYDASNNISDFLDMAPVPFAPANTAISVPPVAGEPAAGANASVTDGLSSSVKAVLMGNPVYAQFSVPGVATGTWSLYIDSVSASAEIDNISIVSNATTSVNSVILSTTGITGVISGTVLTAYNTVVPPPGMSVGIGAYTIPVNSSNGRYSIRLPPGTYDVTANPALANATYQTQTYTGVTVSLGDETANENFTLSQGGELQGWVTRDGLNPLGGVSVVALDSNGNARDTEVSATNGSFTLINLSTGPFTVQTVLDSKETSSPGSLSGTVIAGTTVSIGTFTVTGAMGTIKGTVTASGESIQTGVLIVASTATISAPPPAISSKTLTTASYYNASSLEDGTYSLDVRGSTTTVYNVVAFYMKMAGTTPVISSQTISNITVTAGQVTPGKNFSW